MRKIFIDTNIFLRYLTADDPAKYVRCREIFKKAVDGKISLLTSDLVIAELVWTLQSFYKVPKNEVIEKITVIISTSNIFIPNKNLISEALVIYSRKNIDYIDAYNAVFMKYNAAHEVLTYDSDFDMFEDIKRLEP
jgi:predicted nucleic-acid-binding protein